MFLLIIKILTILIPVCGIMYLIYWYSFRFEPVNFKLSEITIKIKSSPGENSTASSAGSLKILHLSDFHLRKDRNGAAIFNFVKNLEKLTPDTPDIIVLTGDLVEKNAYIPYLKEMLVGLNAKLGKFAVFGVHDYYSKAVIEFIKNMFKKKRSYRKSNDVSLLIKELDSIGIKVLRNCSFVMDLSGKPVNLPVKKIEIVGIDDAVIEKSNVLQAFNTPCSVPENTVTSYNVLKNGKKLKFSDLETGNKTMHFLNSSEKLLISLTHTPDRDVIADIAGHGADIILSGHTHGGQVRLPLIGAIITGANIKRKYACGLFYFKTFVLYISRGLGEGRYSPFRFYCQPEASLITVYFN